MKKRVVEHAVSLGEKGKTPTKATEDRAVVAQAEKPVKVQRPKKPIVSVEPMGATDRLKELLNGRLKEVEAEIRKFQSEVATINTDAGYEVKRAADYLLQDLEIGFADVLARMEISDYKPDTFAADVLAGKVEDVPLVPPTPVPMPRALKQARGERRLNMTAIEDEIAVDGEMLMARN